MPENNKIVSSVLLIPQLDEASYKEANRLFLSYKNENIITFGFIDYVKWDVTDEYQNYTLNFEPNDFCDEFLETIGITSEEFVKAVKTYVLFKFGDLAFVSLRDFLYELKCFTRQFDFEREEFVDSRIYDKCNQISEFFSLLKVDNESKLEQVFSALETLTDEFREYYPSDQRTLASFESYFKFNDIVKRFWEESTSLNEKLFYFPVYLWWNLSGVLPMRPREFVLTPRNCLKKQGDSWELTVLKDKLKGSHQSVHYRISDDYKRVTYRVPDKMADLINWYLDATKSFADNKLKTLFITDTHYKRWDRCTPFTSRYFTYTNLTTCLRYFFEQIVSERYGYTIIYERHGGADLADDEIEYLYLGDTRHLAMINIIMEEAPPVVAEVLAGHSDMNISAHYYSNVTEFVQCKARRQYMKMINGKTSNYTLSKRNARPLDAGNWTMLSGRKFCCNEGVANGDFSQCFKTANSDGLLGGCENCIYFLEKGMSFKDTEKKLKENINIELTLLNEVVRQYRSHIKGKDDIVEVVLKLQNEGFNYMKFKMEQMKHMDIQAKEKKEEN